jgi:hypothetical protein
MIDHRTVTDELADAAELVLAASYDPALLARLTKAVMAYRETMAVLDDLVSSTEIALMFGFAPSAISNHKKRFPNFPKPVTSDDRGRPLYSRKAILAWYRDKPVAAELEQRAKVLAATAASMRELADAPTRTEN